MNFSERKKLQWQNQYKFLHFLDQLVSFPNPTFKATVVVVIVEFVVVAVAVVIFVAVVALLIVTGWVGWGLHSHFHVQPIHSVEFVLLLCCRCRWDCNNIYSVHILSFNTSYSCA